MGEKKGSWEVETEIGRVDRRNFWESGRREEEGCSNKTWFVDQLLPSQHPPMNMHLNSPPPPPSLPVSIPPNPLVYTGEGPSHLTLFVNLFVYPPRIYKSAQHNVVNFIHAMASHPSLPHPVRLSHRLSHKPNPEGRLLWLSWRSNPNIPR